VKLSQTLREASSGVLDRFPDAVLSWKQDSRLESEKGTQLTPSEFMPQFLPPRLLIQRLWLCASALRDISSSGWAAHAQKWKKLGDISAPELTMPEMCRLIDETRTPMETQLWRLQDLRYGGLVYSLELFFQAIKSSGKAASLESSRELYGGTFVVITRRWRKVYKRGIWTERLLVDLLGRVLPAKGDPLSDRVPDYIIEQFLTFLVDVLGSSGNTKGSHVEDATSPIGAYRERSDGYQCSIQTEGLLVDLLQRVLPADGDPPSYQVPPYIIDHFLTFLAEMLATKNGDHVQYAISLIKAHCERSGYPSMAAREALLKLSAIVLFDT
jgi:hypothetical protein